MESPSIVKDKYGQVVNTEKVYGVELRIICADFKSNWWPWKKYKTMHSMLQGLEALKASNPVTRTTTTREGRKVVVKDTWEFRPVHVYYNLSKY